MARYQRAPNGDYETVDSDEEPTVYVIASPSSSVSEPSVDKSALVLGASLLVGAYLLGRWWQKRKKDAPTATTWTP